MLVMVNLTEARLTPAKYFNACPRLRRVIFGDGSYGREGSVEHKRRTYIENRNVVTIAIASAVTWVCVHRSNSYLLILGEIGTIANLGDSCI